MTRTDVADLVVLNARVLTMDAQRPRAEAVALARGRVLACGRSADMRALAAKGARVIDARGASVTPGIVEGHMHLFAGAAELDHLNLAGVEGEAALASALRAYAAARPSERLLLAQSADYEILGPGRRATREDLDRILPDRPFAMAAADHHTMWANTAALKLGGLLNGLAVGPGNEVVMGSDGLAAGELREGEAFGPLLEHSSGVRARLGLSTGGEPDPAPSAAERAADREIMARGLAHCAEHGITSLHNMDGNLYQLELLAELEAEGRLTARCKIPFHFKNFMELDALDKAVTMAERYRSDTLSSGFVKMFYDGVLDGWTAVMVEPYADRPGYLGEPLFTPERFAEVATAIDRRGLQIAVHAIGDGAVRAVLDGYEAARRANGQRDSRHRIEHIEVAHPDDFRRFAALGVLASMQPAHPPGVPGGFPLEPTVARIGRARWPYAYACRTLMEAGATLVFATDWPVSPIDPLASIAQAMTRAVWAEGLPDQRLSLHEALAAYTLGGAYAEHREADKGVLRPGALGDLVVYDGDLEAAEPARLAEIRPAATVMGGRVVFERGL